MSDLRPPAQSTTLAQLTEQLRKGGVDRRGFLKKATALGLSLAAANALVGEAEAGEKANATFNPAANPNAAPGAGVGASFNANPAAKGSFRPPDSVQLIYSSKQPAGPAKREVVEIRIPKDLNISQYELRKISQDFKNELVDVVQHNPVKSQSIMIMVSIKEY